MKQGKIKSIMLMVLFVFILAIGATALSVTLNAPSSGWQSSNDVMINFTVIDNESSITWCAVITNKTGSYATSANYSLVPNNTSFVRGIGFGDTNQTNVGINVRCWNGSVLGLSSNVTIGIDGTAPIVTQKAPLRGAYLNSSPVTFTYKPTDPSNLQTCELFHNVSDTFELNITNTSATSGQDISNKNIEITTNGHYSWNAACNQTSGTVSWMNADNTTAYFIFDTTLPDDVAFSSLLANNTISSDTTPTINWTEATEINFDRYDIIISRNANMSSPIHIQQVPDKDTVSATLSELGENGTYFIIIRTWDLAGNRNDTTETFVYTVDTAVPVVSSIDPAISSWVASSTVNFTYTVTDDNPDTCQLWLSNSTNQTIALNKTIGSITANIVSNITIHSVNDGNYKYFIQCNDSIGTKVNSSNTSIPFGVDTVNPTVVNVTTTVINKNSTDITPTIRWFQTTETNFLRYTATAYYANGTIADQNNITTKTANTTTFSLASDNTYYFNVTVTDKAGNTNFAENTNKTSVYYTDPICASLQSGWNLCGIVQTTARNLSVVGAEMSASFVSVWNSSNEWQTCAIGVSFDNCDVEVGIANDKIHHVWIYVAAETSWDRTWTAVKNSSNMTVKNVTTGWNIIANYFRKDLTFEQLNDSSRLNDINISMYSKPSNSGSNSIPFVTQTGFNEINKATILGQSEAMWVFTNGTKTYNVGLW